MLYEVITRLEKHDKAIECYEQILKLKTDHTKTLSNMGVSLCIVGDVEEGIDYFYRALEITPNEPTILTT